MRMKRPLLLGAALLLSVALALPAAAQQDNQTPEGTLAYALQGDASGLTVRIGPGGLALSYTESDANSEPTASGLASAQCEFDAEGRAQCVEGATEESAYPGDEGDSEESCAKSQPPPPLGDFLVSVSEGCAFSRSGLLEGLPFTANNAKAGPLDIKLNPGAFEGGGELENVRNQVIDALRDLLGEDPPAEDPFSDLLTQILQALENERIGQIEVGPVSSDVNPEANVINVTSTAKGPIIRLFGVPKVDATNPDNESCPSTDTDDDGVDDTTWLYTIRVGESTATALIDTTARTVDGDGTAAVAMLTQPNLETGTDPTDCRTDEVKGDSAIIAEGTPVQSEISIGGVVRNVGDDFAEVRASGVKIHLFQGTPEQQEFMGGVLIGTAVANAAVAIRVDLPPPTPPPTPTQPVPNNPPDEPRVLPDTGADDYVPYAVGLLVVAAAVALTARRLARR